LFTKKLDYFEKITPFFNFGTTAEQDFDLKLWGCVLDITVEFNGVSKTGF
jgi:hypothetical protein